MTSPRLIFIKYSKQPSYLIRFLSRVQNKILFYNGVEYLLRGIKGNWVGGRWRITIDADPAQVEAVKARFVEYSKITGELVKFQIRDYVTKEDAKALGHPLFQKLPVKVWHDCQTMQVGDQSVDVFISQVEYEK